VTFSFAQRNVTGTVVDNIGEPLSGVNITVKGTTTGVISDVDGKYAIVAPDENSVLVFSYVGFIKREMTIGNKNIIDVTMLTDEQQLGEVVVVGYGTQSRGLMTTSVSKLDGKILDNIPYANIGSAFQGTLPGVRVQSTSGQPGALPRIIIRGGTSINSPDGSTPLYIIDGIQRTEMNDVNAADIESVQVLKDAAATSIYGSRGSNGVVIITTKSGKAGKTVVSYNLNVSAAQTGRLYDLATAREFIYFQRRGLAESAKNVPSVAAQLTQAMAGGIGNDLTNNTPYTPMYLSPENEYKLQEGWETMPDPLDPTKTIIFKGTDFQDKIFRTALSMDHSLSISGGTDKSTFSLGLGYLDNEGVAIQTDYKRYSFNANGNIKINDKIQIGGRATYTYSPSQSVPSEGTVFKNDIATSPVTKYTFEDGSLAPGRLVSQGNPVYYISIYDRKNVRTTASVSVDCEWEIISSLKFSPQISFFQTRQDIRSFTRAYLDGPTTPNNTRSASASATNNMTLQMNGVLSYVKSLANKHNLDARAGYEYYGNMSESLSAAGQGAATDNIPTLNASASPSSVSGSESKYVIIGYFARINYDFDHKYLLSLNARFDGASPLGDNKKWGFFPGISVGWNLHQEPFWESIIPIISQLKPRASYGVNGNISNLGAYAAQGTYAVGSRYNSMAAITNTVLANQNLQWEQAKTLDFGIDLGLIDNRFNIVFDYYNRITDNLLATLALPYSTGFSGITTNMGSLQNRGFELELNTQILPKALPFQWNLSINTAKVKNKILKLPDNGVENNRSGGYYIWDPKRNDYGWFGGLQEGGTIGDLFAYKQIGIYATDEDAAADPVIDTLVPLANKTKTGGDVKWLDSDNNGKIEATDRVYVGNQYPKWTGGFSNYFSYKNLSLSCRMDYTLGHTIYYETGARLLGNFSGQAGLSAEINKSWQNPGDITDIPKYYWADQNQKSNLYRGNSRYYQKGDFLSIREVTISYTIPSQLVSKLKISSLRVNLTGNNLHYFTKYQGLNPEDGGTDNGRYPLPRTLFMGLHLSF
jgi:TonB-linked SusC/RagA family outer membrane protein